MNILTSAPAGRRRHLTHVALVGAGALLFTGLGVTAAQAVPACTGVAPQGIPTVQISSASVVEGNTGTTMMAFTLTRSGEVNCDLTVVANTGGGTAVPGLDYVQLVNQQVTFVASDVSETLLVAVVGDTSVEFDETLQVTLTASIPGNAVILGSPATGTIVNDDPGNTTPPGPGPGNPPGGGTTTPPAVGTCVAGSPNSGNNNRGFGNSGNNNRGNCNSGNNNRGDGSTGNNNRP